MPVCLKKIVPNLRGHYISILENSTNDIYRYLSLFRYLAQAYFNARFGIKTNLLQICIFQVQASRFKLKGILKGNSLMHP
jgi:hypothetical protein